jgi:hypothetical protein
VAFAGAFATAFAVGFGLAAFALVVVALAVFVGAAFDGDAFAAVALAGAFAAAFTAGFAFVGPSAATAGRLRVVVLVATFSSSSRQPPRPVLAWLASIAHALG